MLLIILSVCIFFFLILPQLLLTSLIGTLLGNKTILDFKTTLISIGAEEHLRMLFRQDEHLLRMDTGHYPVTESRSVNPWEEHTECPLNRPSTTAVQNTTESTQLIFLKCLFRARSLLQPRRMTPNIVSIYLNRSWNMYSSSLIISYNISPNC